MSTRASAAYLLGRVAARAGLGVWRHRVGVLLALIVSVGLGVYVTTSATVGSLLPLGTATAIAGGSGDCADTDMTAFADKSPDAAQRAYQCMAPAFQQRVPEQTFVQQLQTQTVPNVKNLARV